MSDLQIEKTQQEQEPTLKQNSPISHKQLQQSVFIPSSSSSSSSIMVDLDHHHTHNNSLKRHSPPSSSTAERSSKKHSFNQEDLSLTGNDGFSANALPISVCGNFLRYCISDPYTFHDQSSTGLPPLPSENLRRCKSDVIPSKAKTAARCLNSEENIPDDSMKLKKMKERLTEMKQLWDEVVKEDIEDEKEEGEEHSLVAEENKTLSQDEKGKDYEEAISVEWIEKSLNLTFRCPCGKGYEVQICGNNCYYKLV
ncbi:uncharacterized protein LOC131619273 [Vicia villosa]|uniref:uncharacterized protein LOC131619273 n=1 Tax=Vicia villosa TaxID=3911 RepID=UPI00273B882C|nr:uncharacterized protein LOC131619273 [Vicia villosa]